MFSNKSMAALAVLAVFGSLVFTAVAQWSPGSTEVSLGGFELTGSAGHSVGGVYFIGRQLMTSQSINSSSMNNTTVNNTSIGRPHLMAVLDLSNYAQDRLDKNLTGYVNIMYPLAESSGFTATTGGSGSGGGGGGCGC